jgi:hypothetical protein
MYFGCSSMVANYETRVYLPAGGSLAIDIQEARLFVVRFVGSSSGFSWHRVQHAKPKQKKLTFS